MTVGAATIGIAIDQLVGEPPARLHPVAAFGSLMQRIEHLLYADRRRNGVVFLAVGVGSAALAGHALRRLVGAPAATACATLICAAGRMLDQEAARVAAAVRAGDLPRARHDLRALVGRVTDDLDEQGLSRAVIESVAENGVDAVTASLFWASIGGAAAVLAHRGVNTLDAMVGHRTERYRRFGWASARLDDLVNVAPAHLTALAVAIARPASAPAIWHTIRRDAGRHPSPNGGLIEAAFAAALDVQLGGINRYAGHVEDRGVLGSGRSPSADDVAAAISLRRQATLVCALLLAVAQRSAHVVRMRRRR